MPTVSVIIPCYNVSKSIADCLNAVQQSDYPNIEIIVVDDKSTDNTVDIVRSFKNVQLYTLDSNGGCARAKNFGAKKAAGALYYFLDSDVVVFKNTIGGLIKTICDYSVELVAPRYSREPMNNKVIHHYKAMVDYVYYIPKKYRNTVYVEGLLGGGGEIILAKVFHALNGFNEKYSGASVEREDLWICLKEAGYQTAANAILKTRHYFPDFKDLVKAYVTRIYESAKLYDGKHYNLSFVSFETGILGPVSGIFLFCSLFAYGFGLISTTAPLYCTILFLIFNREVFIESSRKKGLIMTFQFFFIHFLMTNLITITGALSIIIVKLRKIRLKGNA